MRYSINRFQAPDLRWRDNNMFIIYRLSSRRPVPSDPPRLRFVAADRWPRWVRKPRRAFGPWFWGREPIVSVVCLRWTARKTTGSVCGVGRYVCPSPCRAEHESTARARTGRWSDENRKATQHWHDVITIYYYGMVRKLVHNNIIRIYNQWRRRRRRRPVVSRMWRSIL